MLLEGDYEQEQAVLGMAHGLPSDDRGVEKPRGFKGFGQGCRRRGSQTRR